MPLHQVLVSASPGDAITNAAFELRGLLRRVGASEIYACHQDPRLAQEVRPLSSLPAPSAGDRSGLLLFHGSIGEPGMLSFLRQRPERLVLVYHNISPATSFEDYDPVFASLLERGRRDLADLRDQVILALAVSAYNAAELEALGYRNVKVVPLITDTRRLLATESDPATARHLETEVTGPVLLFVGQLLPHKRPDLLVEAYHVLVTHLVPEAHLVLVGAPRLPRYRAALQRFVEELRLGRAWIAGSVTPEQLVAFYRRADCLVTASEHEGFCVPLLEAMAFGMPVVARAHGAIPETLGGAGLLLPPDDDPLLLAEAMAAALCDDWLRRRLVESGRHRLGDFDPDAARAMVLESLVEVA